VLGDDTRRITGSFPSLDDIHTSIAARFNTSSPLELKWVDEDGDHVSLVSGDDLLEAFQSMDKLKIIAVPTPTVETGRERTTPVRVLEEEPPKCSPSTVEKAETLAEESFESTTNTTNMAAGESPAVSEDTLEAHLVEVLRALELPEHMAPQIAGHLASAPPCMVQSLVAQLEDAPEGTEEPGAVLCVHLAAVLNHITRDMELSIPEHLVVKAAGALSQMAPMARGFMGEFREGGSPPCGLFNLFRCHPMGTPQCQPSAEEAPGGQSAGQSARPSRPAEGASPPCFMQAFMQSPQMAEMDRVMKEAQPKIQQAMKEAQPEMERVAEELQAAMQQAQQQAEPQAESSAGGSGGPVGPMAALLAVMQQAQPEIHRAMREMPGGVPPFMQAFMQGTQASSNPWSSAPEQTPPEQTPPTPPTPQGSSSASTEMLLEDPADRAQEVAHLAAERATMLMSMGFTEVEATQALDATQGSLERAADWLFVTRHETVPGEAGGVCGEAEAATEFPAVPEPVEEVPAVAVVQVNVFQQEWVPVLEDLSEMGFDQGLARDALVQSEGDMKLAIRTLVAGERSTR